MKTYKITVNNKVYEVEVEEVGVSSASRPAVQSPAPAAPKAAAPAAPAAPAAAPVAGGNKIDAPMPGTVLDILVAAGDQVEAGQVLLILEAMKMENEIMAPAAGKVVQVVASKGASVNAGDALLVLE